MYVVSREDGLDPARVAQWQNRIGIDPHSPGADNRIVFRGREGLATYSQQFSRVTVRDPDAFECIMYHRSLSMIRAHCELCTPRRSERSAARAEAEVDTPYLMVAAHRLNGQFRVTQFGRQHTYESGQFMVLTTASPFTAEITSVCETAMLLFPQDVLGGDVVSNRLLLPMAADSTFARATAQFLFRFTYDAAGRNLDIDPEAEMAAIELVRAALGHFTYSTRRLANNAMFIREAVRDLIEHHYADPDFSAHSMADILHMSRRHLYRRFADAEESPTDLINARRLVHARELLSAQNSIPLDEVARQSGFRSVATLRNRFRAEYGTTPSAFRAEAGLTR